MSFDVVFKPIRNPGILKLFLFIAPLLTGILLLFINPVELESGDFMAIAWIPGQELLANGAVSADYPYPLWTLVVLAPFIIWPLKTATLLWYACNLLMLAASLATFISLFEWEISPIVLLAIVALAGYFPPVLYGLWHGQLTIFLLLILALSARFFLREQWTGLGIVLGLSFIKPHMLILLAGLLLLLSLMRRRWQTLLGFGATILTLVIVSLPFASSPAQIIGSQIGSHLTTYINLSSTLWGLFLSLGFPWPVPFVTSLGLMACVGWLWFPLLRGAEISSDRVVFLFSTAVITNLIVIPYSWLYNLILLILPLGYSISLALRVKNRMRLAWLTALFTIMHPLMLLLLILNHAFHFYQIIPALALFAIMLWLERQTPLPA